jgi:hypothetical protein
MGREQRSILQRGVRGAYQVLEHVAQKSDDRFVVLPAPHELLRGKGRMSIQVLASESHR